MQQMGIVYRRVGRFEFLDTLAAAKRERGDHGLCVSYPEADAALFIAADGQSGYALDGANLGSVFSLSKGRLQGMIADAESRARRAGETELRIDCFEGLLPVYAGQGFAETGRIKFDWQFAPEGWSSRLGTPDVIFMSRPIVARTAA